MRLTEHTPRKEPRLERERGAVLDAWPLPAQAAIPEADEPLDRSEEGDDEPITEKVPAGSPPRGPGQR
jgi:hypothetical protein